MPIIYCRCREFIWNLKKDGLTFFPWIHRHFWALSKIKTFIRKYFVKCSLPGFHQVLVAIFMIPLATGFGPTSPQLVMSQPYPVPLPLPQPKSCPLPDSRGIPDTLNLFFFLENILISEITVKKGRISYHNESNWKIWHYTFYAMCRYE